MLKKYMSILALSALVSSTFADECCSDVKPEAKAEVMEAVCPCPESCMKTQDENCCKEECKSEMVKSSNIQGSKVQLKFNYNGKETSGEAYMPNNMDVKVSVDDVALISMTISALDNDRVAIKAALLVTDKETGEIVPQEEATHEVALGEQAHFEWTNLTMDITVSEVCDLSANEQAAEQEAQPEAAEVQSEVAPEAAQDESIAQPEEAAQAESVSQTEQEEAQPEQESPVEEATQEEAVVEEAPVASVEQVSQEASQVVEQVA